MARKNCKILVFHIVILKVFTSAGQPSIKQYLHVTGVGPHSHSAGLASLPTVGLAPRQVVPNTGLSALSAFALPGLISALQQSAVTSTPSPGVPILRTQPTISNIIPSPSLPTLKQNTIPTNTQNGALDSNVLNNLAIALQLLIVSNILNSAPEDNDANPIYNMLETAKNIPHSFSPTESKNNHPVPSQMETYESYLPNANFVGSSGFTESSLSDPYIMRNPMDPYSKAPNSRNSFALMSPYEALGPNSPFSDPILSSPFGSVMSSKKDFQSPYSMIQDDVFSMSDIF